MEFSFIISALRPASQVVGWLIRKFRPPDPAEITKQRLKWKRAIEIKIPAVLGQVLYGRAIVRDVKRLDTYPDVETPKRGISPWFRVELANLYHRGILVVLRGEHLVFDESIQDYRRMELREEPDEGVQTVFAYLVGKIPFEHIVDIDWEGDEYYPEPHFYCRFWGKGKEPYQAVSYYVELGDQGTRFLSEVIDHDEAKRNLALSKKLRKRNP